MRGGVLIIHSENPNVIICNLVSEINCDKIVPFYFLFFLTINIYRYNQNIIIDVYFYVSIIQGKNYNHRLCSYCLQDRFFL